MSLTPNIKFYYVNQWDSQALTATTENASFPKENTQSRSKTKRFKTTDLSDETLRTNGSSNINMAALNLFNCNFTSDATVKVQGSNDNWVSTPYDIAMIRGTGRYTGQWVHYPESIQTYDDWGVYINDPGCADAFLAIGRVWLASSYWEPAAGYNAESRYPLVDPTIKNFSDGKQVSTVKRPKYLGFDLGFNWLPDRAGFEEMFWEVGYSDQIMIQKIQDGALTYTSNPQNNTFLVMMNGSELGGIVNGIWNMQLPLEEDL